MSIQFNSRPIRLDWLLIGGLGVIATIALFCFDPNRYGFYPQCIFHQTTGLLCPGCGGLRAIHHLLHGDISAAFQFNLFLVVSLLCLLLYLSINCIQNLTKRRTRLNASWKWLWFFLGGALVFGIWRNIPGAPFAALPQ